MEFSFLFFSTREKKVVGFVSVFTPERFFFLFYFVGYNTASRVSEDTSRCGPSNNSANFLRPSAPNSVISLSSERVISLMLTSLTSVSGIPSIFSGTTAKAGEKKLVRKCSLFGAFFSGLSPLAFNPSFPTLSTIMALQSNE